MKKILSLIGGLVLITPFMGSISACGESVGESVTVNIDVWNLSTWGDEQRRIINKEFFNIVFKYDYSDKPTWDYYCYAFFPRDLNKSVRKINSLICFYDNLQPHNVVWSIAPTPNVGALMVDVFKKGLNLSAKGVADGFTGEFNIDLKGDKKVIKVHELS